MNETTESMRGAGTREALIAAAIQVFGRDGFHAASTRSIADTAGVNQALIGYHFGGKEGLYLAALESIAAAVRERTGAIAAEIETELAGTDRRSPAQRREQDLALLLRLLDGLVAALMAPESEAWAGIVLREQQAPTRGFEVLYDGYMAHLLDLVTELARRIVGGDRGREELAVLVITIVGQVLVFRVAHAAVLRRTGWSEISRAEITAIQRRIHRNVKALLEEARKS